MQEVINLSQNFDSGCARGYLGLDSKARLRRDEGSMVRPETIPARSKDSRKCFYGSMTRISEEDEEKRQLYTKLLLITTRGESYPLVGVPMVGVV